MGGLKHIRAILALPVMVVIIIPGVIIYITGAVKEGWSLPVPFNLLPLPGSLLLVGLGLTLMVKTIALFSTVGHGTLAPWNPTQQLVVRGVYRHVRNPMISGVSCILLGEALGVGSVPLLTWFVLFVIMNLIYIPLFEEPGLEQRFGENYRQYQQYVPRWIPRWTPWEGPFRDNP